MFLPLALQTAAVSAVQDSSNFDRDLLPERQSHGHGASCFLFRSALIFLRLGAHLTEYTIRRYLTLPWRPFPHRESWRLPNMLAVVCSWLKLSAFILTVCNCLDCLQLSWQYLILYFSMGTKNSIYIKNLVRKHFSLGFDLLLYTDDGMFTH